MTHLVERESNISRFQIGREWRRLVPGAKSSRYLSLIRADAGLPCPTITTKCGGATGAACVTHPFECRTFSIGELKRLCGFPDDFEMTGDYEQRYERFGRALPPVMVAAIASTIRDRVLS